MADQPARPGVFARIFGRRTEARALVSAAPTTERGRAVDDIGSFWDVPDDEKVPELRWPANLDVYDEMRRQDAQVISVLRAVMLPIRRTPWRIDPNGARDEVVEFVAANLNLPIAGREQKTVARQRDRFSWPEHLQHALTCLPFGHSFFEQTYRIEPDAFGVQRAWIRKLGWRPPKTITKIDVAPDGGLVAIEQGMLSGMAGTARIEVDRLVAYVNEREGGNWLGQSLLRPAYKHWKLKDILLRVQAQTIERNGMGVPVVEAPKIPENIFDPAEWKTLMDRLIADGLRIAKSFRAGRSSGASIANGASIKLLGVEGQLPDAEKPIRYQDEQIARAVLAHFLNLGTETGSWALGSTFADFFTLSLQTVALHIADTATMHIVEDLVDINFGTDEPAPRIVFDEIGSQQRITAEAIKILVDAGIVTPDQSLEQFMRQTYALPERDGVAATQTKAMAALVQQVYAGVGVEISADEARDVLRQAGFQLDDEAAETDTTTEEA